MEFKLRELLRKVSSYTKEDVQNSGDRTIYAICFDCYFRNEIPFKHIWKNNGFVCTQCHQFIEIDYLEPYQYEELTINNTPYHIYVN